MQVSGAAAGVSAVGSAPDVLSQRTAARHRRTGHSQSQAGRRHQHTPAGKHEEEPRVRAVRALQHAGREDGPEGARDTLTDQEEEISRSAVNHSQQDFHRNSKENINH